MQVSQLFYALMLILLFSSKGEAQKIKDQETKKSSEISNSYILDSSKISSNQNNYKIIVLEDIKKKNQENPQHNSLPIIIKKESKNGDQDFLKNNQLIFKYNDNCPADGFQKLVSKNNFFTIEQTCCKGFMFVQSYTTFKITESQKILLYKYGEEYTDRSNPDKEIKNLLKTTKDFGVIKFENVTDELLIGLSNEN